MRRFLKGLPAYCFVVAGLFAAFLTVGLYVYRDYGISWDEEFSRTDCGQLNYDFVRTLDSRSLLMGNEKYHGPAFELLLVALEHGIGLTDSRDIFFMRHLVTFLTFYAAVFVFFLLLRERFDDWKIAVCGVLFLILSPRIFAESFYNSKDLAFLSLYVVSMYTLVAFRRKMGLGTAVAHALACAVLVDVRIPGLVVPGCTILLATIDQKLAPGTSAAEGVRTRWPLLFTGLFIGFTVLFWPILWLNPAKHLFFAFEEMRSYHFSGNVLYLGRELSATSLPWHYIPVWAVVTTPILYSILFVIGLVRLTADAVRAPREFWQRPVDVPVLLCLFLPLVAIVGLHSVVYDGWRHLYFTYPAFLFVSTVGLATVVAAARAIGARLPGTQALLVATIAGVLLTTAYTMVREHPFENVYFNYLAGPDMEVVRRRFDTDYWGLSYRRGLEYILAHDDAPEIVVRPANYPGPLNAGILPSDERTRLHFTYKAGGEDYFITNFRGDYDYATPREAFAVTVDGGKILLVEKLK
jgi:hypothetical protein